MKNRLFQLLSVLYFVSSVNACAGPITYSAEPIEAWIVDAETKKPLEGVVVVAHWVLEGGIHVDRVGDLVIQETLTDKNGRFYFPAWGPIRHWKLSRLTYMDPEILIFKAGYDFRRLDNPPTKEAIEGKPYPVRRSQWNGKTIELKPIEGYVEARFKVLLSFSKSVESFAIHYPEPCNWIEIPQTLEVMLRERINIERAGITSTWDRTLDKQLLDGEAHFSSTCGPSASAVLQRIKSNEND
jgi:hypothetical protein